MYPGPLVLESNSRLPTFSFPRSAWERTAATLCVAPCAGRDAERPDCRSHAERGHEGAETCLRAATSAVNSLLAGAGR